MSAQVEGLEDKGERHNDIYHRMRSVASRLTRHEMHLLAIYYASVR